MDKRPATKKCKCGELATLGTHNCVEIAQPPGHWRQFRDTGPELLGCNNHPPESFTTYLDGRVIRTRHALPERVTEGLVQ